MSKYLITGVCGFVGRYFVEYLQKNEQSADIFGVDITSSCQLPIHYHQIDLNNENDVNKLVTDIKPDYIVHLASISSVGQSWADPSYCFRNNTNIMLNILNAVIQNNLKTRILSIGSSEEYGNNAEPLSEDTVLAPQNPYAVAKASQEMLGRLYAQNMGGEVVMTRSFNHIGPGQSTRFVIPSFIKQLVDISKGAENKMLVGNINVARDFTDVRDVVDAYYKILHHGKNGEVYNVCSGTANTLKGIIKIAEDILNIHANIIVDPQRLRPNETDLVLGNNNKLKTELNWLPKYNVEQTIKDIIATIKDTES